MAHIERPKRLFSLVVMPMGSGKTHWASRMGWRTALDTDVANGGVLKQQLKLLRRQERWDEHNLISFSAIRGAIDHWAAVGRDEGFADPRLRSLAYQWSLWSADDPEGPGLPAYVFDHTGYFVMPQQVAALFKETVFYAWPEWEVARKRLICRFFKDGVIDNSDRAQAAACNEALELGRRNRSSALKALRALESQGFTLRALPGENAFEHADEEELQVSLMLPVTTLSEADRARYASEFVQGAAVNNGIGRPPPVRGKVRVADPVDRSPRKRVDGDAPQPTPTPDESKVAEETSRG